MAASNARPPSHRLQRLTPRTSRAGELRTAGAARQGVGAFASGALAVGGFALGAIAVGAVAIGALAVGRLAVGRARIGRLEIDELSVRRLVVTEELHAPQSIASEESRHSAAEPTSPFSSPSS